MSHRHVPRQPDRDVRMHDPHPHALVTHTPHAAPPHLNGNAAVHPSTPNHASAAATQLVSPTNPNNAPASTIHKLALANEQTWLLIGTPPVSEMSGE